MEKNKKRFAPIVITLFTIIWQSLIEAIVTFFATVGLTTWWEKRQEAKDKAEEEKNKNK